MYSKTSTLWCHQTRSVDMLEFLQATAIWQTSNSIQSRVFNGDFIYTEIEAARIMLLLEELLLNEEFKTFKIPRITLY